MLVTGGWSLRDVSDKIESKHKSRLRYLGNTFSHNAAKILEKNLISLRPTSIWNYLMVLSHLLTLRQCLESLETAIIYKLIDVTFHERQFWQPNRFITNFCILCHNYTYPRNQNLKQSCLSSLFNYMLKINNRNTRTTCEICSKLTIETPERRHWRRSGVFIVNFEHISHLVLRFLLLTLSR